MNLRNAKSGKILAITSVIFCIVTAFVIYNRYGVYQNHLDIVNHRDYENSSQSLVYKDCSQLVQTWGSIVSSHGIKNSATFILAARNGQTSVKKIDEYILRPQCQLQPGHITTIYVGAQYLQSFSKLIQYVPFNFVLISGDADTTVPDDISGWKDILASKHMLRWYAQNLAWQNAHAVDDSYKLRHLPIGLDLHTLHTRAANVAHWGPAATPLEQVGQLMDVASVAPDFRSRIPQLFCNFHLNKPQRSYFFVTHTADRAEAEISLRSIRNVAFFQDTKKNRLDTWTEQSRYAFVASPHGVGLDCHRTWEALALGSVPVVKTSPLNHLYDDLPVLIVDSWDAVTPALLADKQKEFASNFSKFNLKRLTLQYWLDEISRMT